MTKDNKNAEVNNTDKKLHISDVMNSNSEHRTIRDMRFELRMSGIDNIKRYSNMEVVELFNNKFGRDKIYIGIDREGNDVNYCS